MSDPNNPLDWAAYADEDFRAAKILLRKSKPLPGPSCFHSQQCAEKYVKAMLIHRNIEFPSTQDLLALDTLCNNAGIRTGFVSNDIDKLSSFAAQAYGSFDFQITPEEAQGAIEIAKTVRRFARSFLGLKR
jgi:HEPN domain-containing protein